MISLGEVTRPCLSLTLPASFLAFQQGILLCNLNVCKKRKGIVFSPNSKLVISFGASEYVQFLET